MSLPRALVAEALGVDPDTLPEGDLPLERFAQRYHGFLCADEDTAETHPDIWTADLMMALCEDHPAPAFAAILATLRLCDTPETVSLLAAGPLEDLLASHGPEMIGPIEDEARESPRFRYALTGVWSERIKPLVWARVVAARSGPALDEGDPVPEV